MTEKDNSAAHLEEREVPNTSLGMDHATKMTESDPAMEMLKLDEERADQLRRELETSTQAGWLPSTDEEKKFNSRLNLKLDLMVSL